MIFTVYFTETRTGQEHVAEYDCMDEREAEELFLNDFGGQTVIDGIDCDELGGDDDYDDSMDGDFDSAMASAGFGTDEDYGYYGEE